MGAVFNEEQMDDVLAFMDVSKDGQIDLSEFQAAIEMAEVCKPIYIYIYIYICMSACMRTYVHVYTPTYMHVYIQTYIHTRLNS